MFSHSRGPSAGAVVFICTFPVGRHALPPTELSAPDVSVRINGAMAVTGDELVIALAIFLAALDTVVVATA